MDTATREQNATAAVLDPEGVAFMNGEFIPLERATISVRDFGFIRSDVTYDAISVWNGKFFRLELHLDRFLSSASKLRLNVPHDKKELREILNGCVAKSGLRRSLVSMVCTRGRPTPGTRDVRLCQNKFFAYAAPFVWIATEEQQAKGISAIVSATRRIPSASVDPTAKNYHWLDLERSQFEALDRGAHTAVLLDYNDNVAEGVGFNVFAVLGNRVVTPDRGGLEGITRQTVIDICRKHDIPLEVRPLSIAELRGADEIFAASTAGGVMPIVKLDDRVLGNGAPRPVASRIRTLYWEMHDDPNETTPVTYET